ncbi:hypothetical protein [Sphingomonas sp. PR090111-T3T-6A]|nr:hypothetical protein [Sphingomonas sp. PR090111-T3T-6A]
MIASLPLGRQKVPASVRRARGDNLAGLPAGDNCRASIAAAFAQMELA